MTDIEKARQVFQEARLAFPKMPEELALRLKESGEWLLSTREVEISPYVLARYVEEAEKNPVEDYAVLSHSGHGVAHSKRHLTDTTR